MSKTKPYALLIFDWDGTLMDSGAHIVLCMQQATDKLGLEPRSVAEVRHIIGLGLEEAVRRLYPQARAGLHQALVLGYREQILVHNRNRSPLFDGVRETLLQLLGDGYQLAIATGKSRRGLDQDLETSGLASLFPITRCADETFSKPHPLMLEEILTDYNLPASQALMIGDTEYDLQMANNARMDALAVTYGMHSLETLLLHKPRGYVGGIRELPAWLEQQEVKH